MVVHTVATYSLIYNLNSEEWCMICACDQHMYCRCTLRTWSLKLAQKALENQVENSKEVEITWQTDRGWAQPWPICHLISTSFEFPPGFQRLSERALSSKHRVCIGSTYTGHVHVSHTALHNSSCRSSYSCFHHHISRCTTFLLRIKCKMPIF